ncbi:MAG: 30S ribosomal protein S2 [Acidobacteriota bacterium]|jgi:small subunit ribosomal protein S2|nr:30S ribosomal protein S2 [Acidobacteriota bacterium]
MVSINMREMLEAGVHFGHQVRRWNPKMKPYIYGKKNGIYIINLQTSIELFKDALQFVTDTVARGGQAMIVGTKKQAQSIIEEIGEQTGMHYVNKRWLGGLLTNFPMIKKSIDKLIDLDEMKRDGRWDVKSKKEQSRLEKVYKKLYKNLWGLRNLRQLPGVVIVVDAIYEDIAINEARKLGIPLVAVVDTNANPEIIDFPIPGNDDAIRSIRLFVSKFGEAVQEGLRLSEAGGLTPMQDAADMEPDDADEALAPVSGEGAEDVGIVDGEPGEKEN